MAGDEILLALVGGALPSAPAKAQQTSRVWRVGYLSPSLPTAPTLALFDAFRFRLRELGYVEGKNLIIEHRRAEGDLSRLPRLAAELVATQPDAILGAVTPAIEALQRATLSIPIVMGPAADPIGSGFVKSLAKPGGNITGVSLMSRDLSAKTLEYLNTLVPNARRIAALMSANPVHPFLLKEVYAGAQALGLTIVPVTAAKPSDLEAAFAAMLNENCDALVVFADPVNSRVPELAAKSRLPAVYQFSEFAKLGGLLGYGPNLVQLFRRSADYIDKILKGANPADLPVEQPTKFDLAINLTAAKTLGITVPLHLQQLADEVIE